MAWNHYAEHTWGRKLEEEASKTSIWESLGGPPEPPPTPWQRLKRNLAYHLWRRWKGLRFGFYRKRDAED